MRIFNSKENVAGGSSILTKKTVLFLWAFVFAMVLVIGWGNDHASCTRSNDVRLALHGYYTNVSHRARQRAVLENDKAKAALDLRGSKDASETAGNLAPLQCDQFLPTTSNEPAKALISPANYYP